jgi:hypothetical protein
MVVNMRKGNRLLAGLAAAMAACGGSSQSSDPRPETLMGLAILRVENQSFIDFNIFVFRNETRQRLGRSTANTTQAFKIPSDAMTGQSRVRFAADPIGRQAAGITREIDVLPGDTVFLTIPPT